MMCIPLDRALGRSAPYVEAVHLSAQRLLCTSGRPIRHTAAEPSYPAPRVVGLRAGATPFVRRRPFPTNVDAA